MDIVSCRYLSSCLYSTGIIIYEGHALRRRTSHGNFRPWPRYTPEVLPFHIHRTISSQMEMLVARM